MFHMNVTDSKPFDIHTKYAQMKKIALYVNHTHLLLTIAHTESPNDSEIKLAENDSKLQAEQLISCVTIL